MNLPVELWEEISMHGGLLAVYAQICKHFRVERVALYRIQKEMHKIQWYKRSYIHLPIGTNVLLRYRDGTFHRTGTIVHYENVHLEHANQFKKITSVHLHKTGSKSKQHILFLHGDFDPKFIVTKM